MELFEALVKTDRIGHLNTFILKFRKNLLPVDMSLWSNTKTSNESWSVLGTTCTVYRQLSSSILPRMSRTVLDSANSSSMLLSPDDNIQIWCFAHRQISAELLTLDNVRSLDGENVWFTSPLEVLVKQSQNPANKSNIEHGEVAHSSQ